MEVLTVKLLKFLRVVIIVLVTGD